MGGLCLCLTAALGGCATFVPAERLDSSSPSTSHPDPLPEIHWPQRRTADLEDRTAHSVREIYAIVAEPGTAAPAADLPENLQRELTTPIARIVYTGVHGQGIIRQFEYPRANRDWRSQVYGSLRFVSYSDQPDRLTDPRPSVFAQWTQQALSHQLAGSSYGLKLNDPAVTAMLYEGMAIRILPPPADAKPIGPVGTIVHMSGLGSMEWELPLLKEMQRRGWWVIRISTPRVWWYKSKPWTINSRQDAEQQGAKIAAMMDDLVAEIAYTAEGVVDYLAKKRPDVPLKPLVMVGCSAGALGAPAVVARIRDKFDAAILIGGGANLLQISQTSDLTDAGITIAWKDNEPRGDWRDVLFQSYLDHSQLDPYRTAPMLRDLPVLVVNAEFDLTVPARNGWLLWDRLGRPDRMNYLGEHRLLFFGLGNQASRIVNWMDGALKAKGLGTASGAEKP